MPRIGTDSIYNTKHWAKTQTRSGKNAKILSNTNKNKVPCNCKALFVCHQILFTGEFIVALSQTNQGVALYITNFIEIAYHPFENEHILFSNEYISFSNEDIIIAKKKYNLRLMRCTYGDDIRMYISSQTSYIFNDIPLLSQWIKNTAENVSFSAVFFGTCGNTALRSVACATLG